MSDPPFHGGTIPDGIERLTKLEVLHVADKGLEGSIPWNRLAQLQHLRILILQSLHGPALPTVKVMEEMQSKIRQLQRRL